MENELVIRLGFFAGLFTLFAVLEAVLPKRKRVQTRARRWITNWALTIVNSAALRLLERVAFNRFHILRP